MTKAFASHRERQIMEYLRSGEWKLLRHLPVAAGQRLLKTMLGKGWIEQRGEGPACEIKITDAGSKAVRAPIPMRGS
jgi:hypothetical protein